MILDPQIAIKLVYIFGIVNIIGIILVLTSCRCMGISQITNKLYQYQWYQKYYNHHCKYWYIFLTSVAIHTALAFYILYY